MNDINRIKGMGFLTEEKLIEKGIVSVSLIGEGGFRPLLSIEYIDGKYDTISDIDRINEFIEKLK